MVLIVCFLVVGCISYWLVGYAFAWSEGNPFIGWNNFAFTKLDPEKASFAFYQLIFANTASTIVTGSVAERFNLPCYFLYGVLLTGLKIIKTIPNLIEKFLIVITV